MLRADLSERAYLTPREIAKTIGVQNDTVLAWIATRQLIAADVSRGAGERPRWRIDRRDLDAFLAARRTVAPAPVAPRRRAATTGKQYV